MFSTSESLDLMSCSRFPRDRERNSETTFDPTDLKLLWLDFTCIPIPPSTKEKSLREIRGAGGNIVMLPWDFCCNEQNEAAHLVLHKEPFLPLHLQRRRTGRKPNQHISHMSYRAFSLASTAPFLGCNGTPDKVVVVVASDGFCTLGDLGSGFFLWN